MPYCNSCGNLTMTVAGLCAYCDPSTDRQPVMPAEPPAVELDSAEEVDLEDLLFVAIESTIRSFEGLNLAEVDAVLEAVRIQLGVQCGPTTHGSARLLLSRWIASLSGAGAMAHGAINSVPVGAMHPRSE